jgi:hypothetical protein
MKGRNARKKPPPNLSSCDARGIKPCRATVHLGHERPHTGKTFPSQVDSRERSTLQCMAHPTPLQRGAKSCCGCAKCTFVQTAHFKHLYRHAGCNVQTHLQTFTVQPPTDRQLIWGAWSVLCKFWCCLHSWVCTTWPASATRNKLPTNTGACPNCTAIVF